MKNFFKRVLSLVLSVILVFSAASASFAAGADSGVPLIYVGGQGAEIMVDDPDGSSRQIYPFNFPDDFIENIVKENIGIFAKAVVTQQWDEFCDVVYEIFSDLYSELKLDENGRPVNNSKALWDWKKYGLYGERLTGSHNSRKYEFHYDWRLDPYEIAETLHDYIEYIIKATGSEKVALSGRCLGACVVAAYMEKYDGEYISDLILYASALNGATQISKLFCGELYLDADGVERYIYDIDISADRNINELIKSFVTLYNDTYGLDIACWSINNVYPKIYMNIIPRLLMDTYGTFPGFWSMVSQEDYLKAKETVFFSADMEKYANFIDIIDRYHYNVQYKARKNLKSYVRKGIDVSNIVKYGYQTVPVTENGNILSDDICDVRSASMGATTSNIAEEFSAIYLKNAAETGADKYISPDLQIDASTCLFPEKTWFIKNLDHKNFPDIIDNLFDEIINNDNYTVFSDENYPQYLVYNKEENVETFLPMTQENKATDEKYKVSFFEALGRFVKSLYNFLKIQISNLIGDKKTQEV